MPQIAIKRQLTQGRIKVQICSPRYQKVPYRNNPKKSDAVEPK